MKGCGVALGDADLARRLGAQVCSEVVSASAKDTQADVQLVADVRAGNVALPKGKLDPFAEMLLVETSAPSELQALLAPTLGPADAHHVAFADELGQCSGTWGGRAAQR